MCGITYAQPQTNVNCLQIEKSAQWHDPLTEPHAHPSSSGDIVQQIDVPMYSFIVKILSPAQKTPSEIIRLFMELQQNNSTFVFESSKMCKSLQYLESCVNNTKIFLNEKNLIPHERFSPSITEKQRLEEEVDKAFDYIRNEISNICLNTKSSLSKTFATYASVSRNREEISTGTSYAELWARISTAITIIQEDYVDFYADLMKKYTDMYQSFNENVQKASSDAVHVGSEANTVDFNAHKMKEGYKKFEEEVESIDLGSVKNWDEMSQEEKQSMVITLSPAFNVDTHGAISFNLEQYKTTHNVYPDGSGGEVSTVSYQAWLATFNAAGSALQSNMQSFAQRYTQANNTFDNLNKVLSSVISTLGESAKDVLKALS
ncbi:IpaD/SipD/SspD family type III secretion system needle tip protein [Erwinia amylovora]|uniref:IpaD/SipD/SspD family type III secretion system needle tip protein n=1 Tax=Erwinia amylovora TaxID=552 RepID=UPI0014446294|nr:IpaD/SipD/SspD family type III secretion system needle tip protein [Erwinia amylovora]